MTESPTVDIEFDGITLRVSESALSFMGTHALISAQARIDAAMLRRAYLRHLELGGKHLYFKDGREITDAIP